MISSTLWLGLDVGSTTVKAVVVNPLDGSILFSSYRRHGARQVESAADLCAEIHSQFPAASFIAAVCGSGGKGIAEATGAHFIQEVVANSVAVRHGFPRTRTAIELGGQDAKIIFFHHDVETDLLVASDMRMNGSCAGGTGAFIDEVASILNIKVEDFDRYASGGSHVYDISGRCGVFAKTDIQPLLNQGVSKEDIALSTFHAIAKQSIGGLAQGLEIKSPVIFEGGPLTFNKTLIRVFAERLGLDQDDMILPDEPQTLVAWGAAMAIPSMERGGVRPLDLATIPAALDQYRAGQLETGGREALAFFQSKSERDDFTLRHQAQREEVPLPPPGSTLDIWIGIDGGSTTSKCVALDSEDRVLGSWYTHNKGKPLEVMTGLLLDMERWFKDRGIEPRVRGLGTTGYAEVLFAKAYHADWHTVETVSHAHAALHYVPQASFVLDIGGQDMKAIVIQNDIVTGIVLNEACSAGCGSFLENFAGNLGIEVKDIAERAFASEKPSILGSRCTVFMNSSIITEQKNGKGPDDIMAGLCRSIVENVFTKVMRVSNFDSLGSTVVVQGGTFKNDAVLRAMEQYTGRKVLRAPYPGEMGAIGIALLTKERHGTKESGFIGFKALSGFAWEQKSGLVCKLCTNNCMRTVIEFADGGTYVTGNRCERGEITSTDQAVQGGNKADGPMPAGKQNPDGKPNQPKPASCPDLMVERNKLLFADYPYQVLSHPKELTIGIPRSLEFWNSMPFWRTFFQSLGFKVVLSSVSSQKLFQSGLQNVPSDTVCFPAKVVHGHIKNLIERKVDRIFMPMMNRIPVENKTTNGTQVCAVVKGYPLVINYSDEPERKSGIPFDHPMFHWFTTTDRDRQITDWCRSTFNLPGEVVALAIAEADKAQVAFKTALQARGEEVLADLDAQRRKADGSTDNTKFAVVLAGRPYHGDMLINHELSGFFRQRGIPVLTLDSLPGLDEMDLSATRAELTNAFHARMYAGAMLAARDLRLEMVQIVSFGCGHDAIISDEISKLMKDIADKTPLILKLDESDVKGPLNIRVRSFIETVTARRAKGSYRMEALPDPFSVKFTKKEKATKTILLPNVTPAWTKMIGSAMRSEGYIIESMPMADHDAIALGKQYVHNDMCYPAQVNVGEMLGALRSGKFDPDTVACGLAKSQCDCRLAHYASLARKALDEAGYPQVPIITTDKDTKGMHPAFKLGLRFQIRAMWGLNMVDVLEHLQRRLRPYELVPGQTEEIFEESVNRISAALNRSTSKALKEFEAALDKFAAMPADMSYRKPRVFVIGEFLLNFHAASNMNIESYLEKNGMEAVLPATFTPIHRDYLKYDAEVKQYFVKYPFMEVFANDVTLTLIDRVQRTINKAAAKRVPFFEPPIHIRDLASVSADILHHTFTPGEGWLIPAEIIHNAEHGINSFVILQPFGCMPNHVVGRGLIKTLKERYPRIQILPLDFDPDTSFANIENRLQMLIINARELEGAVKH